MIFLFLATLFCILQQIRGLRLWRYFNNHENGQHFRALNPLRNNYNLFNGLSAVDEESEEEDVHLPGGNGNYPCFSHGFPIMGIPISRAFDSSFSGEAFEEDDIDCPPQPAPLHRCTTLDPELYGCILLECNAQP